MAMGCLESQAAFGKEAFEIAVHEREAQIEPDSASDDVSQEPVAGVADVYHARRYRRCRRPSVTVTMPTPLLMEGGKGSGPRAVQIQVRPDPLAK